MVTKREKRRAYDRKWNDRKKSVELHTSCQTSRVELHAPRHDELHASCESRVELHAPRHNELHVSCESRAELHAPRHDELHASCESRAELHAPRHDELHASCESRAELHVPYHVEQHASCAGCAEIHVEDAAVYGNEPHSLAKPIAQDSENKCKEKDCVYNVSYQNTGCYSAPCETVQQGSPEENDLTKPIKLEGMNLVAQKQVLRSKCKKRIGYNARRKAQKQYHVNNKMLISERRKEYYKKNALCLKTYGKENYGKAKCKNDGLHINAYMRQYYKKNAQRMEARMQQFHKRNIQQIKACTQKKFKQKLEAVKQSVQLHYKNNSSVIKKRKRVSYIDDPSSKRRCYSKKINTKVYGTQRFELKRGKSTKNNTNLKNLSYGIAVEKFKKPLANKVYAKYVDEISSLSEAFVEAENIIKWAVAARRRYIKLLKHKLYQLKGKVDAVLTKSNVCESIVEKYEILTGKCLHTSSTEPYFSESAYVPFTDNTYPIQMDSDGVSHNLFDPPDEETKNNKKWKCNPKICNTNNVNALWRRLNSILRKMSLKSLYQVLKYIVKLDECDMYSSHNEKAGHPLLCHMQQYRNTDQLFIRNLSIHYPYLRTLMKLIYVIRNANMHINTITEALRKSNITKLREYGNKYKKYRTSFEIHEESVKNEDELINKHKSAYEEMKKMMLDEPSNSCMSCEKLLRKQELQSNACFRKPITGHIWEKLNEHIEQFNLPREYICKYCLQYIRQNKIPPTCLLNKLYLPPVPMEVAVLNEFEKLFIQRAKAYQVVMKMGTVSGKNKPVSGLNKKVVGRTFHLPLPLQENINRLQIAKPQECIMKNQELYILVRSIPTKQRQVWESLINLTNVYNALIWLKTHNPLYKDIIIPNREDKLLAELSDEEVQFDIIHNSTQLLVDNDEILDDKKDPADKEHKQGRAMITQANPNDQLYHHCTILGINEQRDNKSAKELYQLLKVDAECINNIDQQLDIKCFPDLYCTGCNGLYEERNVKLGVHEYCKLRMMSSNPQYRLNMQFIFFLQNIANIRQLASGIYHKLSTTPSKLTAAEYLKKLENGELETNMSTIFSKLRNSPSFWWKPRNEISAMIDEYGPATFFLTLSPGEYNWADLDAYLREVNKEKAIGKSTSALIVMDPISTSRFVNLKFKAIMKFITNENGPLGNVTHYVWRREYQSRGMQHFHILLWIENAPTIGDSTNEEVVQFINKFITCSLPEKEMFPILYDRVTKYQTHHHNSYCMRAKNTKKGMVNVCRFGFPRAVTKSLTVRSVARSIYGRRNLKPSSRLYDLPRKEEAQYINDYNAYILLAWDGNMDIQFVGEKSRVLTHYITKYQTKPEKSANDDIFEDINSNKSLKSRLWNMGMRMLQNRECGALEAADTLLGHPLFGKDRNTVIKYVNVYMKRDRKLKNLKAVQELNENSTDIYALALVDDYYPNRPEELEDVCLYEFVRSYDIYKGAINSEDCYTFKYGVIKKRKNPCLVVHKIFNVKQNPENYFYALLLLYKPWYDTSELKGNYSTYTEAFNVYKEHLVMASDRHEKLEEFRNAKEEVEKLINEIKEKNEISKNGDNSQADNIDLYNIIEAAGAVEDFNALDMETVDESLDALISKMNTDQKRVLDYVTQTLNEPNTILRHFVSGVGGTGKSFIIRVIKLWVKQHLSKDVAIAAPTGIAAFNVNGLTIHRLLQLPVEHGGVPKYNKLSDQVLKILRELFKNIVLLIIDEISMVSNITLLYIHLRLCEIFNTEDKENGWFGKIHIMLFGDLLQLPPVMQQPPFVNIDSKEIGKYLSSLCGCNMWEELFTYDELTINMRQKDDTEFTELLARIRLGIMTENDVKILSARRISFIGTARATKLIDLSNYMLQQPENTVCLLPTRAQCDEINQKMLELIPGEKIELHACDDFEASIRNAQKKNALKKIETYDEDSSRTAGLERKIEIKIGAKIMLRRNIDVTLGLVNGAIGTVQKVLRTANGVVTTIQIKFDKDMHNLEPVVSKFEVLNKIYVHRKQFPISLAYGMTIHKSQGLSLSSCLIDIGNKAFAYGQSYVALSRVTSLSGLHIINFDPTKVKAQDKAINEYNRLRMKYRPEMSMLEKSKPYRKRIKDEAWYTNNVIKEIQQSTTIEISENVQRMKVNKLPPGYKNDDGVSCYANAVCQCIFSCKGIRDAIAMSSESEVCVTLKEMIQRHSSIGDNETMSAGTLRIHLGTPFSTRQQQCAAEFLENIILKCSAIEEITKSNEIITKKCVNPACGETSVECKTINIIRLTDGVEKKSNNIVQLVAKRHQWKSFGEVCKRCKTRMKEKSEIQNPAEIIVFQIWLLKENGEKKEMKVTGINEIINIQNSRYKIQAIVFHKGSDNKGHYVARIRSNKLWITANDTKINIEKWRSMENRELGEAYLLFCKKMS